jgi:hypothetical protein
MSDLGPLCAQERTWKTDQDRSSRAPVALIEVPVAKAADFGRAPMVMVSDLLVFHSMALEKRNVHPRAESLCNGYRLIPISLSSRHIS